MEPHFQPAPALQPIAERDQTGAWTDYIYANGQKIARVSPSDNALHTQGNRGT